MVLACLCTICFVFCYTSWCFYAFSRTNLLTRCHSASSLFSAVFVFQKSYIGNILRIGQNKSWSSYFSWHETESKAETKGGQRAATPPMARATPWPRRGMGGPLVHLLTSPFCLYILLDEKNLRTNQFFQKTYCKLPPSSPRDREGLEALLDTLLERRITTGGLLHHHACLQSNVWLIYLGLRVHSSSYMDVFSSMCFMFRSYELPIMIKIIDM
jgi:hypothetical protein